MAELEISTRQVTESADRKRARGIEGNGPELLGVMFGAARIRTGLTVHQLAWISGVRDEEVIDLELATMFLSEAAAVAEKLRPYLDIEEKDYKRTLMESVKKR